MDWDVTVPKARNVVDTKPQKKKRYYDSDTSSDDGTLSDWEGVEDFKGKTTVRFEAPPNSKKSVEKPAAEPAQVESDEYYDSEEESEEEQQEPTPPPPKKESPPPQQNNRSKNGKPQESKKKDGPAQNTRSNLNLPKGTFAEAKKQPAKKPAPTQKNQGKGNKAAAKK